jgi:hypothetical protein
MKFEMKKLAKFPLQPNSKLPACKWTDKSNHLYDLSMNKNYGIITGKLNNLLVLDIDVKDHGLEEWNKYITRNGEINTVTVATPSGGLHYYFLYHSINEANEQLLREHLYTQTSSLTPLHTNIFIKRTSSKIIRAGIFLSAISSKSVRAAGLVAAGVEDAASALSASDD